MDKIIETGKRENKLYLVIFAFVATVFGWSLFVFLRTTIVEAECSNLALKTSVNFNKDPVYSTDFEYSKSECLDSALNN
jgi:hypothetical protein